MVTIFYILDSHENCLFQSSYFYNLANIPKETVFTFILLIFSQVIADQSLFESFYKIKLIIFKVYNDLIFEVYKV